MDVLTARMRESEGDLLRVRVKVEMRLVSAITEACLCGLSRPSLTLKPVAVD